MEVADLIVLIYLLFFLPENLVLNNMPVCENLGCLMRTLLFIGAIIEHGVRKGTLLVLVSISIVVIDE